MHHVHATFEPLRPTSMPLVQRLAALGFGLETAIVLDLLPLIRGASWEERPIFFDLDLVAGGEQTLHLSRGVLLDRYKYFEEILPEPRRFLFDLATDPGESVNLLEREPDLTATFCSYQPDTIPRNFVSRYKNILHHHTHQVARREASTSTGSASTWTSTTAA